MRHRTLQRAARAIAGVLPCPARLVVSGLLALLALLALLGSAPAARAQQGWSLGGDAAEAAGYRVWIEPGAGRGGTAGVILQARDPEPDSFAVSSQYVGGAQYAGERIRLRAWVKVEEVTGWAALYMRFDRRQGEIIAFDNMRGRPIRGSHDWRSYDVVLEVPEGATRMGFGILLAGAGKVWADDFTFEAVSREVDVTAPAMETPRLPPEDRGRDRASERPEVPAESPGWHVAGQEPEAYEVILDPDDAGGAADISPVTVKSRSDEPEGFVSVLRWLDASGYHGRRIRFSTRIRTEELDGRAGIWMRVDGREQREVLAFANTRDRPIRGTTDWTPYALVIDVSPDARYVFFGLVVNGVGRVFMDGTELSRVGEDVPVSSSPFGGPRNLDFDHPPAGEEG
jgi:hypothetical protein